MMAEAQAPERVVAPVGGASIATIESLRARLLSERAASKEARQHAHKIALKVSDLQSRLDAEIQHRRKAEVAMKEVLEVLIAKGIAMEGVMAAAPSLSGSSESGEAAQASYPKDDESEHSSGEEASQANIGDCQGSATEETQIVQVDSLITANIEVGKEGVTTGKDTLRADSPQMEVGEVSKDEEINRREQGLSTDSLEKYPHALLDVGEKSNNNQTPEMVFALAKHPEGEVPVLTDCKPDVDTTNGSPLMEEAATSHQGGESNMALTVSSLGGHGLFADPFKEGISSHVGDVEKSKGLDGNAIPLTSGLGDNGAHGNEGSHPVKDKMGRGLTPTDIPPVSSRGLGHNGVHPGIYPRGGYLYGQPHMNADALQYMHYVPSPEAAISTGPMSTAYPGKKNLSSDVVEFGRYPQAPVSDAILSLVDDKNGKLGSILMALNLAKQQIHDEEYASSYTDQVYEAALPSPFFGKPYPGLHESVPHQAPYRPWRPDSPNQAPIVHLPMSPTSDHEVSAFERHDGMRRSGLTSAYHNPGYNPHLQPKGELHLGNGITLYTD